MLFGSSSLSSSKRPSGSSFVFSASKRATSTVPCNNWNKGFYQGSDFCQARMRPGSLEPRGEKRKAVLGGSGSKFRRG
ncbi:hypothetical protein PILCRDRAFT_768718 [Piloderma croceum F 1598]|uniref:Uncharacterized protein n=1 Tax=Piloderma croceum (strain F 1598) TaxID=765440 RepID=A0A0C3FYN3_PILCF|nr:hypothetical protein PILCRDRAFT_768718 [Piloderma croceum F 1598]